MINWYNQIIGLYQDDYLIDSGLILESRE